MFTENSALLNTILALAASLLALSILVQIVQEMFKYLWKSRARLYKNVLADWIGPLAYRLAEAPEFHDLRVRGPLEFLKRKPSGVLLPLGKEELSHAIVRAAPLWVQRTLRQLEVEAARKNSSGEGDKRDLQVFLEKLGNVDRGSSGYRTAYEIAGFLKEYGFGWKTMSITIGDLQIPESFAAVDLERAFRDRFLPHLAQVEKNYSQLSRNMEYAYRRRNVKYTLAISFLLALFLNAPIQNLYERAAALPPEEAAALAEEMVSIQERNAALWADSSISNQMILTQVADSVFKRLAPAIEKMTGTKVTVERKSILAVLGEKENLAEFAGAVWSKVKVKSFMQWFYLLLGCLITAILLSFGAPFWNDVVKAILRFKEGRQSPAAAAAGGGGTSNG